MKDKFDDDERSLMLKFVTGSKRPPVAGADPLMCCFDNRMKHPVRFAGFATMRPQFKLSRGKDDPEALPEVCCPFYLGTA